MRVTRRGFVRLAAAPLLGLRTGGAREFEVYRARFENTVRKQQLLEHLCTLRALGAPLAVYSAIHPARPAEILWVGPPDLLEGVEAGAVVSREFHVRPLDLLCLFERRILEVRRARFARPEYRLFRSLRERERVANQGGKGLRGGISVYARLAE